MRFGGEKGVNINRLELDIVADEGEEAPATTSRTIPPKERVAGKSGIIHMRTKFTLLKAGDFDVVVVEV